MFVPPTFEGVTSVAVIEEIIQDTVDLEVIYSPTLDFRDYHKFRDTEINLILGLPYRGYELPADFSITVDNPFTDFLHFSTYGEGIRGVHITSIVEPNKDPIKELSHVLEYSPDTTILSKHATLTDKSRQLVEAINAYRTWTWESNGTTRLLLALYHASYKRLPKLLRGVSLPDVVKQNAPVIKGQMEKLEDYLERKRDMVKTFHVTIDGSPCILKTVYAEEYVNELANDILMREVGSTPVIVCVGRTTRSNDIFSIRTKGIHAGRVAQLINNGSGKDEVATVFAGLSYAELMGTGIQNKLAQIQE